MNNRLLGAIGIGGALALNVIAIQHLTAGNPVDIPMLTGFDELMYGLWGCGLVCTFWLFSHHGATGSNELLRAAPLVVVAGGTVMTLGSLIDVVGLARPHSNPIFFVAWSLILLGTLVTAILTLVARRLAGWRAFAPLLAVLVMALGVALGPTPVGQLVFGLPSLLLAYTAFSLRAEPAIVGIA